MKQYPEKKTGGKWDNKKGYRHNNSKNRVFYYKHITYPWKNQLKTIPAT